MTNTTRDPEEKIDLNYIHYKTLHTSCFFQRKTDWSKLIKMFARKHCFIVVVAVVIVTFPRTVNILIFIEKYFMKRTATLAFG